MKTEIVKSLTKTFEQCVHCTEDGIEFWYARELQDLLGYSKWDNFANAIERAKASCKAEGSNVDDHFAGAGKMILTGFGAQREIEDIMLTRYSCYLIAMNGDPRKEEIAFAQAYFASQTRKYELIEKQILELERVIARRKLSESEKELSSVIFQQTKGEKNFALIRSKGDKAFFNHTTDEMKKKWKVPANRPLADFAQTIILKAKDFANEITIYNAKDKGMKTETQISSEHITNNASVRNTLISRGIKPEDVTPAEDVKKIERKLASESNKSFKDKKGFNVIDKK